MDNELKRDLLDRGLTESEVDFLINEIKEYYDSMAFSVDDLSISDSAEDYLINELEEADLNTSEYPGANIIRYIDADSFVNEMSVDGVVRLPSGRIADLHF